MAEWLIEIRGILDADRTGGYMADSSEGYMADRSEGISHPCDSLNSWFVLSPGCAHAACPYTPSWGRPL